MTSATSAETSVQNPSRADESVVDSPSSQSVEPSKKSSKAIPDGAEQVQVAVNAALGRKAEGLVVLDLAKVSDFTDYFMICSGTNERQVQAIADAVLGDLRQQGIRPLHVEGLNLGRWVLLDFGGDLVIHVFLDETRSFYGLERLWSDAPVVTSRFAAEAGSRES